MVKAGVSIEEANAHDRVLTICSRPKTEVRAGEDNWDNGRIS